MSRARSCFGQRISTMWVPTTTTRVRKCVFLLGRVRRIRFPLVSCRKCIITHRSGIIPREQARPVHLFPCRTQRIGSPSWYVFALRKGSIQLTTHPSICCVPRYSSYNRSCEEECPGPFAYGERCFCRTR